MEIKQFEDKNLSHFSYAILSDSEKKIILIDPARNPQPYLDYAKEKEAQITGIIETHPHADFISSHLELHTTTGATVYISKLAHALYPHQPFDEGQTILLDTIKLSAVNTPGHSPDSICIVLEKDGTQAAVFTGDTLFVGDCGRPDLREGAGKIQVTRTELAKQMYHSLRDKLLPLQNDTVVYPAHGAGTLCGKALGAGSSSTMGEEKKNNWSLQEQTETVFIKELLADQPFVPAYFPFDVELNRKGAKGFEESVRQVKRGEPILNGEAAKRLQQNAWIIDIRKDSVYKQGHLPHSIHLMEGPKFETWLGSIIKPAEGFYIAGDDQDAINKIIARTAAIGYETQIIETFIVKSNEVVQEKMPLKHFKEHLSNYTIVDVRNTSEVKESKIFPTSISIPLGELRDKVHTIPTDKPIVVHCAGGYRSAAASSLIQSELKGQVPVYDLGDAIKKFQ